MKALIGIAAAAAGVVLALSPEARKTARRLTVQATALLLDAAEDIKRGKDQLKDRLQTIGRDELSSDPAHAHANATAYAPDVEPREILPDKASMKNMYNVLNDDVIKRQLSNLQLNV